MSLRHVLAILIVLMSVQLAIAQTANQRHPRVVEVERLLNNEVQNLIRDFAPGKPFSVSVRIEPLHRTNAANAEKESLPFFETNEEIRDEWDDPARTDWELLSRVTRINVKLTVPEEFNDAQVGDLKSNITARLSLIEGRDFVDVTKKDLFLPARSDHTKYTMWIMGIGVAMLLLLGLVYFLVSSVAITRITRAISAIKINSGDSANSSGGMPAMMPMGAGSKSDSKSGDLSSGGQIRFNDSIKMTEVVLNLIKNIEKNPAFPTLEDMILLEQYLETSPESVGALLMEFPVELRKKLFSLSYSTHWLKALSNPGEIDGHSFELINKLVKNQRTDVNPDWEEFVISCWRLNDQLSGFLKSLPRTDALAVLTYLPRSLSIKVSREVLPGEWAVVLRTSASSLSVNREFTVKYKQECLNILPLRPTDSLEAYKRDVELSDYLHTCDPTIEREVYGALSKDSALISVRPPFFKVLDAPADIMKDFVQTQSIEDWAIAVLNISKSQRTQIEVNFSDRQKFRFIEYLKRYDKAGLQLSVVGDARARIAKSFQDYELEKSKKPNHPIEVKAESNPEQSAKVA